MIRNEQVPVLDEKGKAVFVDPRVKELLQDNDLTVLYRCLSYPKGFIITEHHHIDLTGGGTMDIMKNKVGTTYVVFKKSSGAVPPSILKVKHTPKQ